MIILRGSGNPITPAARKLLEFFMANPGAVITANMAVESGVVDSERMFECHKANFRKALSQYQRRQLESYGHGNYSWIGPAVQFANAEGESRTEQSLTIRTQEDVGRILGISAQAVEQIENRALKKLAQQPELIQAWKEMIENRQKVRFDPFHEIWLFSTAESLAMHPETQDEEQEEEMEA